MLPYRACVVHSRSCTAPTNPGAHSPVCKSAGVTVCCMRSFYDCIEQRADFTAERRKDGWWVTKTPITFVSEKPTWSGSFPNIEDACLAIARMVATEIANRHSCKSPGMA